MPRKKSDGFKRIRKPREKNNLCYVCSKAFYSNADLRRHLLIHTGERPFKCDICDKAFRREGHLQGHKLIHTGDRPHQCEICERQFALKRALMRHMLVHTGEKPYVCETCNKGYTTKPLLRWHMAVHSGKNHRCRVCKKSYYRYVELHKHQMTHYSEKRHVCTICGKAFHWTRNLRIHMSVHTRREKKFICGVCNKAFWRKNSLQYHLKTHLEKLPCKCETCEVEFKTENDYKEPLSTGEYVCELCFKRFRYKATLESHLLLHTREKAHKCEECGLCFSLAQCLRRHISRKHSEHSDKKYSCGVCDKSFGSEKSLAIHAANHSNDKLQPCQLCRKAFSGAGRKGQSDLLTDHVPNCEMRNKALQQLSNVQSFPQSEGNAYVCDACNKIVPKEYFLRHLRAHTGEKLFNCNDCNLGFASLSNLRRHLLKTHDKELDTREKSPLTKPFSDLSELKQHLLTHTKEQNQSCEVCDKAFNRKEKYESYLLTGEAPVSPVPSYDSSGDLQDNLDPADNWSDHEPDHQPFVGTQEVEIANSESNIVASPEPTKKKFPCHQCDRSYTRLDNLKIHYITHTGTRPHVCEFCGKGFLRGSVMRLHRLTHTGELPHKCDVCDKKFLTKFELRQHLFTHTGERPYVCHFCNRGFSLKCLVKKHIKACHFNEIQGPKTVFPCKQCGKTFGLPQLLKKHLWSHSGETPHKCEVCHKSFLYKQSLKVHLQKHLSGKLSHICEFCSKAFSLEESLNRHIEKHHPAEGQGGTFPCDKCDKVLSSPFALKQHLLFHSGVKPYACEVCNKYFRFEHALQKHSLVHRLTCKWCNKEFPTLYRLNKHRVSHSEEKLYECNMCNKKFLRNYTLQGHLMCVHGGQKPLQCELCPESFKTKSALKKHVSTHKSINTGLKPHVCKICSENFLLPIHLRKHMASQHLGIEQDPLKSLTCSSQETGHSNTASVKESNPKKVQPSITFLVPHHIIAEFLREKQGHSDMMKESSCDSKTIENSMNSKVGLLINKSNSQEAANVLLVPSHLKDKELGEKHGHSVDLEHWSSGSQLSETIVKSVNPVMMPLYESTPQKARKILLLTVQPPSLVKTKQLDEKQGHSDVLKKSSPSSQLKETIAKRVIPVKAPLKYSNPKKASSFSSVKIQPPSHVKAKHLSEKQRHSNSPKESSYSSKSIGRRVRPVKMPFKYSNSQKAASISSVTIQPPSHVKAKHLSEKQGHSNIPKESSFSSKAIERRVGPVKPLYKQRNPQNAASISFVKYQPISRMKAQLSSEVPDNSDGQKEPLTIGSQGQGNSSISCVKTVSKENSPQKAATISSIKPWQGITRLRILQ